MPQTIYDDEVGPYNVVCEFHKLAPVYIRYRREPMPHPYVTLDIYCTECNAHIAGYDRGGFGLSPFGMFTPYYTEAINQ